MEGSSQKGHNVDIKRLIRDLDAISYKTGLGKNLRNTLRKVDKEDLMRELTDYRLFLRKRRRLLNKYTYRIKSLHSLKLKYDRYYPTKEIGVCFNDLLCIRVIVESYDIDLHSENIKHVDMSNGKKNDDVGSIVYGSSDSKEIDMIDDLLNYKLEGKDKQVVLLSNLEMWKEYEPFNIVKSIGEFIDKALLN